MKEGLDKSVHVDLSRPLLCFCKIGSAPRVLRQRHAGGVGIAALGAEEIHLFLRQADGHLAVIDAFAVQAGDDVDIGLASGFQRTGAHEFYERLGYQKTSLWFRKNIECC